MLVEYWADYICPWCYLALDRVDHLVERHGAEVCWRPFELHPATPPDGDRAPPARGARDTLEYLSDELEAAGLPRATRTTRSNSSRALALSAWAADQPGWPKLHRGLYRAYFVDGRDIGDPSVLADLGSAAGIAGADAALEAGLGQEAVASSRERALDLGIGATPGWHFGAGMVLAGAQPRATFDRVLSRLSDPPRQAPVTQPTL